MFWMFHICSNPKLKVLNIKYELGTKTVLRGLFLFLWEFTKYTQCSKVLTAIRPEPVCDIVEGRGGRVPLLLAVLRQLRVAQREDQPAAALEAADRRPRTHAVLHQHVTCHVSRGPSHIIVTNRRAVEPSCY